MEICDKAIKDYPHEIINLNFEEQSKALYEILLKILNRKKEQIRIVESLAK